MKEEIINKMENLMKELKALPLEEQIEITNEFRELIHKSSPFTDPVDKLQWIPFDKVRANEYNPNVVAPPEMKLLELSIRMDGYTQPIVAYFDEENDEYIVVDGFHRNRVGKEIKDIKERIHGHLPIVVINKDLAERMTSTIRHNRARGTHAIVPMAKLVEHLVFLGYSDKKIAEQLGMEKDEVLRLKAIIINIYLLLYPLLERDVGTVTR
ncbi:MAG: IbrB-like domain-containing protein [Candidatus Heimdallarchaeota archaeon]